MINQRPTQQSTVPTGLGRTATCDPVQAAEIILRRFGARAVTMLTSARTLEDGRTVYARLSANDCYVALDEACRKMARVALRRFGSNREAQASGYAGALERIFPDPVAYLVRCIRSVISDAERAERRDPPTVSIDQPIGAYRESSGALCLADTLADTDISHQPEEALVERDERTEFRRALAAAMGKLPEQYLDAIRRDIRRERDRDAGAALAPESDRERQTICRARAALAEILSHECGPDNPYVRLVSRHKNATVRRKTTPSTGWTPERRDRLFRKLLSSSWHERAAVAPHPEADVEEAVINEVSRADNVAPPSPEMRRAMRVMDTYILGDDPRAEAPEAQALYDRAVAARRAGRVEEAIALYRAAYEREPRFVAAANEVGVLLSQTGRLRDALQIYLDILERSRAGENRCIAATNAADIYLTWFDAGRNKERNIERATYFAKMAMATPTPMRACNLILAYAKDRYFREAREVLETILQGGLERCPAEKFLKTLFQIRDADLVAWWNWLDGELVKDGDQ